MTMQNRISRQKLIENGISEKAISKYTCNNCRGILVYQKGFNMNSGITLVCVDCATSYTEK
jgi:hypothetical protein